MVEVQAVRKEQDTTASLRQDLEVVAGILEKLRVKESFYRRKEESVNILIDSVIELNRKLSSTQADLTRFLEETERVLQEETAKNKRAMEAAARDLGLTPKPLADSNSSSSGSQRRLTGRARRMLQCVEDQLDSLTGKKFEYCVKISQRRKLGQIIGNEYNISPEFKVTWSPLCKETIRKKSRVYMSWKLRGGRDVWDKHYKKLEENMITNEEFSKHSNHPSSLVTPCPSATEHQNRGTVSKGSEIFIKEFDPCVGSQLKSKAKNTFSFPTEVFKNVDEVKPFIPFRFPGGDSVVHTSGEVELQGETRQYEADLEHFREENVSLWEMIKTMEKDKAYIDEKAKPATYNYEPIRTFRNCYSNDPKRGNSWTSLGVRRNNFKLTRFKTVKSFKRRW